MIAERKRRFPPESAWLSGKRQKERDSMKNNNQINVPQAKEAMEKFKMQAAQDKDVLFTY